MSRFLAGVLLDFQAAAFAVVSGNASGVTPMPSGWIKVDGVDSVAFTLTTASATNVTWTAKTATVADGRDSVPLVNPPTFPTGTNQNASVVVTLPSGAKYLQLVATPSAGSGAVAATPTMVTGKPAVIPYSKDCGILFDCPASATLAGQGYLDFSANYNPAPKDLGLGTLPKNTVADPELWFPATDVTDTAYTVPALVASTGQTIPIRLGRVPFVAMRARFAPSAGFGRYRATYNAKA